MSPGQAWIDIDTTSGVWAHLKIRNDGMEPLRVHNPHTEEPTDGWEHSKEAYQAAVLRSYGFLSLELRDGRAPRLRRFRCTLGLGTSWRCRSNCHPGPNSTSLCRSTSCTRWSRVGTTTSRSTTATRPAGTWLLLSFGLPAEPLSLAR